jgi:hypothetical protein
MLTCVAIASSWFLMTMGPPTVTHVPSWWPSPTASSVGSRAYGTREECVQQRERAERTFSVLDLPWWLVNPEIEGDD